MVGTATESVIRLLSEFKADKLIELNGRKIKLLNIPKLIKIGNVYI
jgi:CRP-like cAMP-binding protein